MKTLLVTGGYGFIGSNFVLAEVAKGNRIINLDKLTYAANKDNLKTIHGHNLYSFAQADIADKAAVSAIFANNKIDAVVNFAAESHVDNSIYAPGEFIQTNIFGVFNLLECARHYHAQNPNFRFLHVSTDEVYGELPKDGSVFTEASQYRPNSPYSASKAASDHLVRAWNKTYGLPTITTNCSNNYGPRQHGEKLIPKIIANCLSERPIPIYGAGENVRDWIYVEDHAAGIALALENGKLGETYCFGGNAELTNNEVVQTICGVMDGIKPRAKGKYADLITYVEDRKGHDLRYAIDDSKARRELGFETWADFKTRIRETINWYLA